MIQFFTLDNINELVLKAHSYISRIGIKIIDDKTCEGSSILEGHFYRFINLLDVIESRKDFDTTEDKFQRLVYKLYGYVNNECIYYNSLYIELGNSPGYLPITINTTFLQLLDTPDSYLGQTKKLVSVNNSETGLEFVNTSDLFQEVGNGLIVDSVTNKIYLGGSLVTPTIINTHGTQFFAVGNASAGEGGSIQILPNGAALAVKAVSGALNKLVFNGTIGDATDNTIVFTDDIASKGVVYAHDYSTLGKLDNRWIPDWGTISSSFAIDTNVVHLTGFSNQLINNGIQLHNTTDDYTLAVQGKGISNSDYQITTNGSNAFFNIFIRNGLGIVGKTGNSIASFNDQNVGADNANIIFYFPASGPKFDTNEASFGSGDSISIFTNNIVRAHTSQGFTFADVNNINYKSTQHTFKDLSGNSYLTLGNGSDGPISEAVHLRVTNAPTNALDVVRLQELLTVNSSYTAATTAVSGINVFGTSYEGPGFGASNPSTLSWVPLIKNPTGWIINNQAVSSAFVCDQTRFIYSTPIISRTLTIYDIGVNDMDFYYTDVDKQAIFANEHLATIAYLSIPDNKKILANSSSVTYTGTWTNGKYSISKQTSGNGNTATFSITGTTVIVSTTVGDGLTGGFTIKIDGALQGTYTNGTVASMITNNGSGINYGPSIKIFTGLSNTIHTVVITTTNANAVFFDWAAGVDTTTSNPRVYVSNLIYQNATGNPYPINNPNVDAYNGFISNNIGILTGLGLNLTLIDINSVINPATDVGAFGLHPNDAGYAKIATKILSTIPSTFYNVGSTIQTLSSANNAASWQVLKNTNAGARAGIGIQFQNDDSSNASIFRASSVYSEGTAYGLYITNNSVSNNTVLTNDIIFNTGALEALRLLSGNVRLPQFKTVGVITNSTNGQLNSTVTLASTLGGSGVNNAGNLTWGAGGTLGSMAFISTASPTFTGTMTVPTGNFGGNLVSMVNAWPTTANTIFGASASGGASYPFTANLHAIIAPRPAFDIVFGSGNPTVTRGYVSALSGNLNWGATSGTDIGALFSVTQPTTGNGTVSNAASGTTVTGVGTQFTNTFKVGDTITIGGETQTISAIASNTSMTTSTWTAIHTALPYTLVGGNRLQVFGNGITTVSNINKVNITAPTTSATLTLVQGSTLATSGAFSTTLTATAATNITLPVSGTLYSTLSGSITSSQLSTSLTDETGTGSVVFSISPTFTGIPLAPTATLGTNNIQIATTAFVKSNSLQRLKSFYTDVVATTSAADAYVYTIPANTLVADGQVINAEYSTSENGTTGTETILFYFAGIQILNTGAITPINGENRIKVTIIRNSPTSFKSHIWVQRNANPPIFQTSQHNSGTFDPTINNDLKFNIVSSISSVLTLTSGIITYLP